MTAIIDNLKAETEIKKISKGVGIPAVVIRKLWEEGIIEIPLNQGYYEDLLFLEKIWGNRTLLKHQLAKFKWSERVALISTAEMDKVSAYIFNRYVNAKKPLRVHEIAQELNYYWHIPINKKLIGRIYRVRNKARRYKAKVQRLKGKILQIWLGIV